MAGISGVSYNKWIADGGEALRYDYDLYPGDLIIDIGSYNNEWNSQLKNHEALRIIKFEAQNNTGAWLYDGTFDLGGNANCMSIFSAEDQQTFGCLDIAKYIDEEIAICKINIEGSEYELIKYMLSTGKIGNIKNLQIQFHVVDGLDWEKEYENIKKELEKTHVLTWQYPFCWENWRLNSYSQVGQDLFVLSQFAEWYKGTFMDIGCSLPKALNNTFLLENKGWNGWNFDIKDYSKEWEIRNSKFIQADALQYDFNSLELPKYIDYLSLDIEGNGSRFKALQRVIDAGIEFGVITIEHDEYRGYKKTEKEPQRRLLKAKGYKLVKADVKHKECSFEDWYINPKYIKYVDV